MMNKTMKLAALLATSLTVAHGAVVVTDHASPFDAQSLSNLATGNGPKGTPLARFSLDYGDSQSQTFTLPSPITLHSLFLGYNDYGVSGQITLSIDAGNDGTYDHVFTNVALSGLQTTGTDTGPVHYLQFDLSSENIALAAGQHKYYFEATLENGAASNGTDWIIAPIRNTSNTYAGGESSILYLGGATDAVFAVTAIPEPHTEFRVVITPNAVNPGNYDFSWDSQAGKVYDLVSATDLDSAPSTWGVWSGNADIAATPDTNTLPNVPGGGDTKRFFAVVEKDAP